jgi:hypothetical protein
MRRGLVWLTYQDRLYQVTEAEIHTDRNGKATGVKLMLSRVRRHGENQVKHWEMELEHHGLSEAIRRYLQKSVADRVLFVFLEKEGKVFWTTVSRRKFDKEMQQHFEEERRVFARKIP